MRSSTWSTIIILFSLCTAAGTALDYFTLHHHKNKIHILMLKWWDKLDETRFINLGKLMANWLINKVDQIHNKLGKLGSLSAFLSLNILITTCAFNCHLVIEIPSLNGSTLPFSYLSTLSYVTNFFLDILTIEFTILILKKIRTTNIALSILYILFDAIIAFLIFLICWFCLSLTFNLWEHNHLVNFERSKKNPGFLNILSEKERKIILAEPKNILKIHFTTNYIELLKNTPFHIHKIITTGLSRDNNFYMYIDIDDDQIHEHFVYPIENMEYDLRTIFLAGTSFIPTISYLSLLLIMFLAKGFFEIYRKGFMYFLEVATQIDPDKNPKDFKPGTLLGVFFGLLAAFIKVLSKIIEHVKKFQ